MDYHSLGHLAVWHHPVPKPRARLLLVHGLGEHSARHENTVRALTGHGIEILRFDLRGAGKSGGRRQWVARFQDYVDDTAHVAEWGEANLSTLPLFVLGHSLGGAIATHYAAHSPSRLAGLILSAPAFRIGSSISPVKLGLGKLLGKVLPYLAVPSGSDHSELSRDPAVGKAYAADPLSCHFNTVQQGNEILKALTQMMALCGQIQMPALIVHGSSDKLVRVEGSFELMFSLKCRSRELHILPGGYHEPHNDWGKEEYFALLARWLDRQLSSIKG